MDNKKLISVSIIVLAISILCSSIWIGYSLQRNVSLQASISIESKTLSLPKVAEYLNMTEEEVRSIIQIENMRKLDETRMFEGKMLPYFTIDNKQYFYKDEIDEWLKEVSSNRRQYNTKVGQIF